MAGLEHQRLVAGGKSVDQGRLPGSGSGRGKDGNAAGGFEYIFEALQNFEAQPAKLSAAMIDGGPGYRAQNTLGHVGGSGDLEEVTSAWTGHTSMLNFSAGPQRRKSD